MKIFDLIKNKLLGYFVKPKPIFDTSRVDESRILFGNDGHSEMLRDLRKIEMKSLSQKAHGRGIGALGYLHRTSRPLSSINFDELDKTCLIFDVDRHSEVLRKLKEIKLKEIEMKTPAQNRK